LVAIFAVLPMVASIHAGRWIDRIGARLPMIIGAFLVCFGTLLTFAWQTQQTLLVTSCFIGIGFMLNQVAVQGLLGQGESSRRLRNFSILSLAMAASGFSGPLFAGLAIDHLGTRVAFGVLALGPLMAAFGQYCLRAPIRRVSAAMAAAGASRPSGPSPSVIEILQPPGLRKVLMANTILSGAWDTHFFLVPLYGVHIGLSATTIGVILAGFSTATFLIRLVLPFIQARVQPWTIIRAAMVVTVTVFLAYPLFDSMQVLMALSFVLGLALGTCQPSLLSMLHHYSPPGRATEAVGLRMALINTSQVFLPLTFGALGTIIGVAPLFWAYALALGLGGWAQRHPPQDQPYATPASS
jgi:MFS family permease